MAASRKQFVEGIRLRASSVTGTTTGELYIDSDSTNTLTWFDGSAEQSIGDLSFSPTNYANPALNRVVDHLTSIDTALGAVSSSVVEAYKEPARAATIQDLTNDSTSPAYDDTAGASGRGQITFGTGPTAIDGVTLSNDDRICVKDESGGLGADANGVYDRTSQNTWDRSDDFDADSEVVASLVVPIEEGTINGDTMQMLTTDNPIVIGGASGTNLVFTSISVEAIIAGAGLAKSVNTLSVNTGDGIEISGDDIQLDLASGGGLKIVSNEAAVEPNDFAGTGLEDDGSDNLRIAAAAAGAGLAGGAGSALSVNTGDGLEINVDDVQLDLASGGGLKIVSNEAAVEPSDFAGSGLEDDGSDNLRIAAAAAGDGLTGGAGSALSVDHDGEGLTFDTAQLALELDGSTLSKTASGVRVAAGSASVVAEFDGSGNLSSSNITITELDWLDDAIARTSAALNDNQAAEADIFTYSAASFPANEVEYRIVRDSGEMEKGRLEILTDNSTVKFTHEIDSVLTDPGVTLNVDLDTGNIRIRYQSTSTGTAPTFIYKEQRLS